MAHYKNRQLRILGLPEGKGRRAPQNGEGTKTGKNEPKAVFKKDWKRKQKKEQKFEAIIPVDLEKNAKNDSELQKLKDLQTRARKKYEPPRPRSHHTRQRRAATNADQPVLLINPRGARPRKRIWCGVYPLVRTCNAQPKARQLFGSESGAKEAHTKQRKGSKTEYTGWEQIGHIRGTQHMLS